MYMCVLKNIKLKVKDLIYQNMLINETVANANFMVNTKRPKESPLPLSMFYLFLKNNRGQNTPRGKKMKLYCKRNECKQ